VGVTYVPWFYKYENSSTYGRINAYAHYCGDMDENSSEKSLCMNSIDKTIRGEKERIADEYDIPVQELNKYSKRYSDK